jgi:polar amino acid transport system ATP-binding protein
LAKERADYKKDKKKIFKEIENRALDTLDSVGLLTKKDAYPCELSGGQQQRVSIARALMQNPKVLFFDEPTSALDPELTGEIIKVIRELAQRHVTMVIVTHEMSFARDVSNHIIYGRKGLLQKKDLRIGN